MKNEFKKVNSQKAKRLFNEGKKVFLVSSNVYPDYNNMWIQPYEVPQKDNLGEKVDFKIQVNSFSYYNCNYELGYRVHYYILESEI